MRGQICTVNPDHPMDTRELLLHMRCITTHSLRCKASNPTKFAGGSRRATAKLIISLVEILGDLSCGDRGGMAHHSDTKDLVERRQKSFWGRFAGAPCLDFHGNMGGSVAQGSSSPSPNLGFLEKTLLDFWRVMLFWPRKRQDRNGRCAKFRSL